MSEETPLSQEDVNARLMISNKFWSLLFKWFQRKRDSNEQSAQKKSRIKIDCNEITDKIVLHSDWLKKNWENYLNNQACDNTDRLILNEFEVELDRIGRAPFKGRELNGAKFTNSTLQRHNFDNSRLWKSNFNGSDLRFCRFKECWLQDSNLKNVDAQRANFENADLFISRLRSSNFNDASFINAKGLSDHQFADCNLTGAKLPEGVGRFESLAMINESTKSNRRLVWELTLACIILVIALLSSQNLNIQAIGLNLPRSWVAWFGIIFLFFWFLHTQLSLQRHWELLDYLPSKFPDGLPCTKRIQPWFVNDFVLTHRTYLKHELPYFYGFLLVLIAGVTLLSVQFHSQAISTLNGGNENLQPTRGSSPIPMPRQRPSNKKRRIIPIGGGRDLIQP